MQRGAMRAFLLLCLAGLVAAQEDAAVEEAAVEDAGEAEESSKSAVKESRERAL